MVLLASSLACSDATGVEIGGVIANAESGQIAITNGTSRPVYTFVIGRQFAALALWAPCTNPSTCEAIAPGATRRVPNPSFPGIVETEAIVNWWHLVPDPAGGFKPDSIRSGVVQLR